MEQDSRKDTRMRTLKAGRIVYDRLSRVFDCTIRNASETGALLLVPSTTGIPSEFLLYMDSDHKRRPAEVIWRQDDRIGIRFTGPAETIV
ncbi:PilZ domain-containing protein [uncultured Roseibium sp.]|uniref:PilZ domain-containing protein n=1 Tax=uncultured Roseibium sp. TaxID=1936171 RepID=UPI0032168954